jgi:ABC-type lipoprotein release transport system permease subunit
MLIAKLALRNLIGAGLRTWLNVFVLSLAFVMIIWVHGMLEGMNRYARQATIDYQVGGGQFWHRTYDPYDPLTLEDSHAPLSPALRELAEQGRAAPILVTTGAIFPEGRVQSVLLKGIDPGQTVLELPTRHLETQQEELIPALIGSEMARTTGLRTGNELTVRWRDIHGTFDAADVRIAQIMTVPAPGADAGQIWLALEDLQRMMAAPGEATLAVLATDIAEVPPGDETWLHRDQAYLLRDITELIRMKSAGSNFLYGLLLFMGLLAIFDTQILSIWRRRKEIGTLMALGMERAMVVGLFTFEGALHGLLALIVGATYGIPVLAYTLSRGLPMPAIGSDFGIALPQTLYPSYGLRLLAVTTLLVLMAVTVVSFLPASKIAKMKPTDALRGKTE